MENRCVMYTCGELESYEKQSVYKWELWEYWNSSKIKSHQSMVKKIKQLKQTWIHQDWGICESVAGNSGMFV